MLTVSDKAKREHVLKRLKSTKHNETIFLAGWEVEILLMWIAELKEQEAKPLCCKECSYHRNDGWCNEHGREVKESDYCSFGAQ